VSVDGKLDLTAERARLARAQAELTELKHALLRGEAVPRQVLLDDWAALALDVTEHVRSMPARALVRVPGFTKKMVPGLRDLCEETLTAIADSDGTPLPRARRKTT
jgi:phage terminase Nu1 subunit (DNA packaging protein)